VVTILTTRFNIQRRYQSITPRTFTAPNLSTVLLVCLSGHQHARGELSCSGTSPALPERNPILVQTNTWRDCQIAFHYTCGTLSGPGLSIKWLLKHNWLSVPFQYRLFPRHHCTNIQHNYAQNTVRLLLCLNTPLSDFVLKFAGFNAYKHIHTT
jgi:hypothetical protein